MCGPSVCPVRKGEKKCREKVVQVTQIFGSSNIIQHGPEGDIAPLPKISPTKRCRTSRKWIPSLGLTPQIISSYSIVVLAQVETPRSREECEMRPRKRCRSAMRLMPKLVRDRECSKVPREVCVTVSGARRGEGRQDCRLRPQLGDPNQ